MGTLLSHRLNRIFAAQGLTSSLLVVSFEVNLVWVDNVEVVTRARLIALRHESVPVYLLPGATKSARSERLIQADFLFDLLEGEHRLPQFNVVTL